MNGSLSGTRRLGGSYTDPVENLSLSCEMPPPQPSLAPLLPGEVKKYPYLRSRAAAMDGRAAGGAVAVGFRPGDWPRPNAPRESAPGPARVPGSAPTRLRRLSFPAP